MGMAPRLPESRQIRQRFKVMLRQPRPRLKTTLLFGRKT